MKISLRKAFSSYVDERILWDKNKLGFPVPQNEWLKDDQIIDYFDEHINNSKLLKKLNAKSNCSNFTI